jgi:hypothetical protein
VTRINGRHVVQMVGDDKLVFTDDHTGVEVVMPMAAMEAILSLWALDVAQGKTFNVKAGAHERITFQPDEFESVKQAVEYFIWISRTPLSQRGEVSIVSFDSIEDAMDFLKGQGS